MTLALTVLILLAALVGSFIFATLAYSLRDYSRSGLAEWFARRRGKLAAGGGGTSIDVATDANDEVAAVVEHEDELALTAAVARAAANLVIVLAVLHLLAAMVAGPGWLVYALTFVLSFVLVGLVGVALPLAVSNHAAEAFIGRFAGLLRVKRAVLLPVIKLFGPIDGLVRRAAGRHDHSPEHVEEEIEQEILDIVAEGRSEGVIDDAEREMIERALRFHDQTAGQIMTPRRDIVGIGRDASHDEVLAVIDDSGYSRIPVFGDSPDEVVGVLYARDLFHFVGKRINGHDSDDGTVRAFGVGDIMRKPIVVPETKLLSDLLRDMQAQKIHMAIVLDEYNGTSGLVTIEDVVEELVGEIADEHDDHEVPLFERIDDATVEADARIEVAELNRLIGLGLPEDEGFETLGGFVTVKLGQIPPVGETFAHESGGRRVRYTVLEAEPQRVGRVRIEFLAAEPEAAPEDAPAEADAASPPAVDQAGTA